MKQDIVNRKSALKTTLGGGVILRILYILVH